MAERKDESLAAFTVDISDLLLSSMNNKLQEIEGDNMRSKDSCTIYRVHPSIREEDSGAYDPKMISIGPFHREKLSFQLMERLKWRFLRDLISRHPYNTLDKYIKEVRFLASQAATCYSAELDPTSDSFVEMLVLDGCFIIEFLLKWNFGEQDHNLYLVNWNLPLLRNDLLLLENQLPFFVIQSLLDLSVIPCDLSVIPCSLMAINYLTRGNLLRCQGVPNPIHHLLHLYHSTLRPPTDHYGGSAANSCLLRTKKAIKKIKNFLLYSLFCFLSLVLYCRRPPRVQNSSRAPRGLPSTTELRAAGVVFKKKESMCMLDVTFRDGFMEMPVLPIQAATIPLFRNLVAFEQCCPEAGSHFTSYVALLENLMYTPEDVLFLERCGILENVLGREEEVWRFFDSLGRGAYLDYENHYLLPLFKDVREYYAAESPESHRWRARLTQDYFSNPWSIISLIAAVVLLALTAIQSFFAVYSYVRPPKGPN